MKPFTGTVFIRLGVFEKQRDGSLGGENLVDEGDEVLMVDGESVEATLQLLRTKLTEVRTTWNAK